MVKTEVGFKSELQYNEFDELANEDVNDNDFPRFVECEGGFGGDSSGSGFGSSGSGFESVLGRFGLG